MHRPCRAVLDRLFLIATWPVRQALDMEPIVWSDQLVQYSCRLLARVVAELASQVCSAEVSVTNFHIRFSLIVLLIAFSNLPGVGR